MSKREAPLRMYEIDPVTAAENHENYQNEIQKFSFILTKKLILILLAINVFVLLAIILLALVYCPCTLKTSGRSKTLTNETKPSVSNPVWNSYKLPNFTSKYPHYDVKFQLFPAINLIPNCSFYGHTTINFSLTDKTSFIVLHKRSLLVSNVSLYDVTTEEKIKEEIKEKYDDKVYDYWILTFHKELKKGHRYVLDVVYCGKYATSGAGLLKSFYYDLKLKKRFVILYSPLEPTGARRMFPCFDQLDVKATYKVSIIHESHFKALSNMPENKTYPINSSQLINNHYMSSNIVLTEFQPTKVPMSTYLLAVILVENFEFVNQTTVPTKLLKETRIWYPKPERGSANKALDFAVNTEYFFQTYFDTTSAFPKSDHIYIPNFPWGALESWGLVMYRDKHLLVPEKSSLFALKLTLQVIAHELAHFWFGNWITTSWWSEIWINEGFATYFEALAYFKQSGMTDLQQEMMYLNERRLVLNNDASHFARPIIFNVTKPDQFDQTFTTYAYEKGGCLLVWLEWIMGSEKFREGIQSYLKKYGQQNPTSKQFFEVMDLFKPINASDISNFWGFFNQWLLNSGYPVVMVNYEANEKEIQISQYSSIVEFPDRKWPIYTSYVTNYTQISENIYFTGIIALKKDLSKDDVFILNNNGKSYIRANYSNDLWKRIVRNLKPRSSNISSISKIVVYDDAFYFTQESKFNLSITKDLMDALSNETDFVPWEIFYNRIFIRIFQIFRNDILFIKWKEYVGNISALMFASVQLNLTDANITVFEEIRQKTLLVMNCDIENDVALDWINQQFLDWMNNPNKTLPRHLADVILYYGLRHNDKDQYWNKIWQILSEYNENVQVERRDLVIGLAGTFKPYLIEKLLKRHLINNTHQTDALKYYDMINLAFWLLKSDSGSSSLKRWISRNSEKIRNFAFGDDISEFEKQESLERVMFIISSTVVDVHDNMLPLLRLHTRDEILRNQIMRNIKWRDNVGTALLKML